MNRQFKLLPRNFTKLNRDGEISNQAWQDSQFQKLCLNLAESELSAPTNYHANLCRTNPIVNIFFSFLEKENEMF